jgi:hypothetical protein
MKSSVQGAGCLDEQTRITGVANSPHSGSRFLMKK